MSQLDLPIEAAFDPIPEPMAYLCDHRIVYCNPAFCQALPDLPAGSDVPEEWAELTDRSAALLYRGTGTWTALAWRWQEGILLRLTPAEDDASILPNRRLSLLSQKLREPAAGLMSAGESLQRILTPFQQEAALTGLCRLNKANLRLLRLGRTLELAALPDGEAPYDFAPQQVELNGLCHDAVRQLSAPVAAAGCTLEFHDWSENLFVRCDDDLILILIFHLVSNALRATGAGGHLELRVERKKGRAHITLLDDGCGMTEQQLATLFAPDRKRDALQDSFNGLGLGLTVCRKIARLHGGMLLLSNRQERGVRAGFSLPLCLPEPTSELHSRLADSTNGVPLVLRELSDVLPERCFDPKDL